MPALIASGEQSVTGSCGVIGRNDVRLWKQHLNAMTLELDGHALTPEILQQAIAAADGDSAGVWYINLIIDPITARAHETLLQEFGFEISGTVTANTRTMLVLRKNLKRSQDGGHSSFSPSGTITTIQRPQART
jgi:hypothetical protein